MLSDETEKMVTMLKSSLMSEDSENITSATNAINAANVITATSAITATNVTNAPYQDNPSIFQSAGKESLSTFTLQESDNSAQQSINQSPRQPLVGRKPREKLETILKQGESLIRKTGNLAHQQATVARPRRLEGFLTGLLEGEERRRRQQQQEVMIASTKPSKLSRLLPVEILARKPRLSSEGDNYDGHLQILPNNSEHYDRQDACTKRPLRTPFHSVVPKIKRASIVALNERLNKRIVEQEQSKQRQPMEERQRRITWQDQIDGDEFGVSDEEAKELENVAKLEDDEDLLELEIAPGNKSNDQGEQMEHRIQRPRIKSRIIDLDRDDHSTISSNPSVQRPQEEDEFEKAGKIENQSHLDGLFEEDQEEEENEDEIDEEGEEEIDDGDEDEDEDEEKVVEKNGSISQKRSITMDGLFDVEAEDEDSEEVSSDEVDEAEIERELRESTFLEDGEEEQEDGQHARVIHQQLLAAEEQIELELLMNRFMPEEALYEQGAFAELGRKYARKTATAEEEQGIDNGKGNLDHHSGRVLDDQATTTRSILPKQSIVQAHSHPDFLRLLQQDQLVSSETEDDEKALFEEGDHDQHALKEISSYDDLAFDAILADSTVNFRAISATSNPIPTGRPLKRGTLVDEQLKVRLLNGGKETTDACPGGETKPSKKHVTFETVSARPNVPKR